MYWLSETDSSRASADNGSCSVSRNRSVMRLVTSTYTTFYGGASDFGRGRVAALPPARGSRPPERSGVGMALKAGPRASGSLGAPATAG